jgi:hypothetical protein
MTEKRIQFNNILQNQLPAYVREEFPLVAEFLKQYYISQEFQGAPADLIQNIDQYVKLDNIKTQADSVVLGSDISFADDIITVSSLTGTLGFPDSYGLLQIDNEIITYTGKTSNSFTGCIRGFSGIASYNNQNKPDELVFKSATDSADHTSGAEIINLSSLFLNEFFNKIKYQLTPGFENREFYSGLDKYFFIKQSKDFYSTKGTDLSFKILFKALYGEDVKVIKPQEYLIKPSDAQYKVSNDLVVESISGDPYDLENSTLFQDQYGDITRAYAPIASIEKISTLLEKSYYKLSFDAGYQRDITFDGSLYGNFSIHPKTKLIGEIISGSNTLDVDSTVGFPQEGELSVIYTDGTEGTISYTSKSINQFFGCQNIVGTISDSSDICLNVFAYGTSNKDQNQTIKVRITSVLKSVDIVDDTYYRGKGDIGIIRTLGVNPDDDISNNWFFNISPTIDVSSITLIDDTDKTYNLITKINHNLRVGDNIKIISNDGIEKYSTVINVPSSTGIVIRGQGSIQNGTYTIQRNLLKVNSSKYPSLSNQTANIQNVYKIKDKTLVASSSLPFYNNQPLNASDRSIIFSGTFVGNTFKITSSNDHGFYTGDSVYYTPGQGSLFREGLYFIQRVNSNEVRFAESRSDIYQSDFISLIDPVEVSSSKIQPYNFNSKNLESQKLLREINPPINDGNNYVTDPGPVGILINGVEIFNYKSKDQIYYGSIEGVDVLSSGLNYDVINPPTLSISDSVGTGATGYCSVKGTLREIRIIDPGFDYLETPKINITGGNGVGAKAEALMKLIDHQVSFNSEPQSALVNIANNTIGFSTYHKFRNAEKVIYKTNTQKAVGGISTDSSYYVSTKDPYTIGLHQTFNDASVGINTITLTSYGIGNHIIESYGKKSVISSINIVNSGSGYENKKRTAKTSGISTSLGYVSIKDHDFKSGEIVEYSTSGSVIGGLSNNTNYYVTVVDENNFKLSLVGFGTTNQDFYYKTEQYIRFTSFGSGIHAFNYPEIFVEVVGNIGISSTNDSLFKASVQPIFRGEIASLYLEENGVGYGSSEILNYYKDPLFTLNSGSESQLMPIINNGKIVEVLVNNPGRDYNSPPNLNILTNGSGVGAVLTPIIENGQIKSVKVVESGAGYDQNSTSIIVTTPGFGAQFKAKLKTWTVNLFQKHFNSVTDDDGFIFYNQNSKYGLQYSHLYAPRKLRESVYAKELGGKILYGESDLKKINNIEVSSKNHSPIIGWAYDGNPIYGPYGYSTKSSGIISQMRSGYNLNIDQNRPPFPNGFFIEDYEYLNVDDDTVLDEYNGRFCVTPEFPNGTYAYFATIDNTSSNTFGGYRTPAFPYLIGNKFKSAPNTFNFNRSSNQDDIDLNATTWSRNTTPYNLLKKNSSYNYLLLPNLLNQTVDVKYASPGSIENIGIITGGNNYRVNDKVIFDEEGTRGFGLTSKVSRVSGKQINGISVASTSIYNVVIYPGTGNKGSFIVESNSPHNFVNKNIITISGLSTTTSLIEGSYTIGVSTNTFTINDVSGVGTVGATGIVTYISVSGNIGYSNLKENDLFIVGNEKVKVLNIDKPSSRIRVLRSIDGTVGSAHSYTDILYEIPRRFAVDVGISTSYQYKINREIYFNPKESLALGSNSGVGIGTTISFSNPGVGITQIFVPTKTIYLPNHQLETGDVLTYSTNTGAGISISSNGISSRTLQDESSVYVAKISNDLIGISTVKVGLGSTGTFVGTADTTRSIETLYFTGIGTGTYHSFKTNYQKLTGQVSRNIVTVSTAQTHGLNNNDYVFVDVNPQISETFAIKYNDYNRKVLVNPKSFITSDVDILSNSITILNHRFITGQKVIYTATSPSGGLVNNEFYYIVVFDQNTIKLSTSYYESISTNPYIVNITSSSDGTLSAINPPIKVYKDSLVDFDLSDSSLSYFNGSTKYSAFELNFYIDSNFTQLFDKSKFSSEFEVKKSGTVGVDTNAKVSLTVNGNIPQKLYYRLDPIYTNTLPKEKEEVNVDSSVLSNNQIEINSSGYSGKHEITSISSTSFTYNLAKIPESSSYDPEDSQLNYDTNSEVAFGAISKIDITSKGQNYYILPDFSSIISDYGSGAILEASSKSIGKITKTKINDIGFGFPSDFSIRPNLSLPQVLKIEPLNSFESIGITSVGRGYNSAAPKLVVLDGKTKNLLPEADLKYSLGDTDVQILNNTYRLNNVLPTIIPTQNSNGVGIGSIRYNHLTNDVTVTLAVGFSTADSFPFEVNDKVLIENISVGIGSTGKGFNSENYNYQLFTLTGVDENIGGIGSVTYSLSNLLNFGEIPGKFDPENSSGRIIPEKYFPTFNSILKPNNFLENEDIRYVNGLSSIGSVEDWNQKINHLRVSSREFLKENATIEGISSKTQGIISSVIIPDSFINLGSYSKSENGWQTETGILNNNLQRVQDSFYYQNFSYSLKSKVSYDTWEDAVGSLNHTAGFKKFSDYQCEPSLTEVDDNTLVVGINTSAVDVSADLTGFASLNCVYDFDLAKENALTGGSRIVSDEITFSSRILTDYFESVGNRVLSIDNISRFFNSNPRSTKYSIVHRFSLSDARAQKYISYVSDRRYTSQRQLLIFTLLHDNDFGYINQYGRVETSYDMGSFDFIVEGSEGVILFYPTKYSINDYNVTTLSCNLKESFAGIGSTSLGGIVDINTNTTTVSFGTTTIVGLGTTYTSSKILVEICGDGGEYEFDELNLVHDGSNVEFIEYGQLTNHSLNSYSSSGLGTYYAYISGSELKIDFTPNPGIAATVSTIQVAITDSTSTGIGTFDMRYCRFEARSTSIGSSTSPISTVISEYPDNYDGGYFIVQVSDITNNRHQLSEMVVVDDENTTYSTEFANLETYAGLGTFGTFKDTNSTQLLFTPLSDIDVEVKVYFNTLSSIDDINTITEYNNGTFETDYGVYYGTERDVRRSFNLTHKNYQIFQRYFNASDSSVVSTATSSITIPNHFFVTGEKIAYSSGTKFTINSPIAIGATDFGVGIGTTDKLPSLVYAIKVDNNKIKLARSAEDALMIIPKSLNITSVGIGTSHSFTSVNQNTKAIVAIDNVIQSPVALTSTTSNLSTNLSSSEDILYCNTISNFFSGDLVKIGDEIMKIESVGIAGTNSIRVLRPWLGTVVSGYSTGALMTKVDGNYNIVENTINFVTAPYGNIPLSTSTNSPNERDWIGISTSSSFQGRVFMRSGVQETSNETYYKNYIFDDISNGFNGIGKTFTLTSEGSNISNMSSENGIVLINNIFQGPGITNDYTLSGSTGITSITFVGSATSLASDINTSNLPVGGIIVSVGSTEGFGYQPLVSAGGTAIVSVAGTISLISIGNSGSGYRSGIQTSGGIKPVIVRVGVATSSTGTPNIEFIGTAVVSNGNIVSIAITNPGIGYTRSNPPYVIIDDPLSYSDIPLIYSSASSGIGTQSTVDIVVGQGSSVIQFEIKNTGYGYKSDEILTVPTGGIVGIPTISNSTLKEFQISIQNTFTDKFSGWSIGELQVFDSIENLFNGTRIIFPLFYLGQLISVLTSKGSNINIQDTLLVLINDVLQVPGEGYIFNGGSAIEFTEAPKSGDTCKILFYKGTGDVDVIFKNILETVKIGDELTLTYDPLRGQSPILLEDERTVMEINSTNIVDTNPYFGPGNTSDSTLERPLIWCRQTEDKIINERQIGKDRMLYEPLIYPTTYLIQSVGIGTTIVFVESIRPFFNSINENNVSLDFQKNVTLISQDTKVSANATAIVSMAGTISSITVSDGGFGYKNAPMVSIQNPTGMGMSSSIAVASITSGIVTSITITGLSTGHSSTNPPIVLIEPPTFEIEKNGVESYSGDFGIISGISTTSVGIASTGIVFDFVIPQDSYLRNNTITGFTTISGIQTGYYFAISKSNVGNGVTSLNSSGSIVGIATTFLDGIYQVASVSIAQTSVTGFGLTYVARVIVSVSNLNGLSGIGFSNYYGNYSWGRINLKSRSKSNTYNAYTMKGYVGISTGSIINRTNPLKYRDYIS